RDSKGLALGSSAGAVRIHDAVSGEVRRTLTGHRRTAQCLAVSPDGEVLASGGYDGTVRLWDVATGQERLGATGHSKVVYALAFSPDGKKLASASAFGPAGEIMLWERD